MRALYRNLMALTFAGVATAHSFAITPSAPQPIVHGPHLSGDTGTLPLVLVKGYPFVEAQISGVKGKLLLDTGSMPAFSINSHAVPVAGGIALGEGSYGSGQTFKRLRFPRVDSLTLPGGLSFSAMTDIDGNPGQQLEQHITPDFIGWLGQGFFDGYVVKLDYVTPSVTFYRDDPTAKGVSAATAGQRVIKTIALGNPAHRNLVTFPVKVGTIDIVSLVDTGSHNSAWLSDEQVAALERSGHLHKVAQGDFIISGISVDGLVLPPMSIDITKSEPPFAKLLPSSNLPTMALGYEFLKLFRTVIDYDRGKMILLNPSAR